MDPRARRSRAAIVRAAVDLIGEGGVAAATVQTVSQRAGVNRATIYRHWPDLADLHYAALYELLHATEPPDTGDLTTDLEALAVGLARSLQSDPWRVLMPSLIGAAVDDRLIGELHSRFTRDRRDSAAAIVHRAVERGQVPPGTDPHVVIEAVVGPLYYRSLLTREAISDDQARDIARRAGASYWNEGRGQA